jgi:electron transport complex protein RnfB
VSASAPSLAQRIDALLPQTQCTRCGYADCRAYAEAIAAGAADINRCPPGGDTTLAALASLTGRPLRALDPACGAVGPLTLAVIDEAACIGCTLCIQACPVDAIIGAPKRMHAVLPSLCSGCDLCLPPCPVDCITMVAAPRAWTDTDATAARIRHDARAARLARAERIARRPAVDADRLRRQAAVAAAMDRARTRRAARAS